MNNENLVVKISIFFLMLTFKIIILRTNIFINVHDCSLEKCFNAYKQIWAIYYIILHKGCNKIL